MSIDSSQVAQSNMSECSAVQTSERCITPTCCIGGVEINKMAVNKNNWNSCSSTACNCTSVNVQPLQRHIVCRRKRRVLDWMKLMPIYWPFNSFTVHNYYCAIRLLSEPTWLVTYEYLARGGQNSLLFCSFCDWRWLWSDLLLHLMIGIIIIIWLNDKGWSLVVSFCHWATSTSSLIRIIQL